MKKRIDIIMTERGIAQSREKAKALIMAGVVFADNQRVDKSGETFNKDAIVEVRGNKLEFVSRGGLKLQGAIEHFNIDLTGVWAIDIGASTGGFTDCMLSHGAAKVHCVDVGYGQLAWKLRTDPRVVNFERTNIRYFDEESLDRLLDFGTVDVAFIGLKHVLPVLFKVFREGGRGVCLIKPQFEAGRESVGKNGVVKDPGIHEKVICNVVETARQEGFKILGLHYSPIRGPKGNIEYLMYIEKSGEKTDFSADIRSLVDEAHKNLNSDTKNTDDRTL